MSYLLGKLHTAGATKNANTTLNENTEELEKKNNVLFNEEFVEMNEMVSDNPDVPSKNTNNDTGTSNRQPASQTTLHQTPITNYLPPMANQTPNKATLPAPNWQCVSHLSLIHISEPTRPY